MRVRGLYTPCVWRVHGEGGVHATCVLCVFVWGLCMSCVCGVSCVCVGGGSMHPALRS